jgi:Domain of unknown function (DUF4326)
VSTPRRIQLSRGKGSRLPAGARSVARPTRFGNPYKVLPGGPWTLAESLALFERDLLAGRLVSAHGRTPTTFEEVDELAGRDLACYCLPGQPCHADLLIKLANPGRCRH